MTPPPSAEKPSRREPDYQPLYCEENIWRLNRSERVADRERWVVFIFSESGQCPLFGQRASKEASGVVFWDYHVVLLTRAGAGRGLDIWDLDSVHGAPLPADVWFERTMPECAGLPAAFHPRFRVVEGDVFNASFASDRSHMRGTDGSFLAPPPCWEPPAVPGCVMNLTQFTRGGDAGPGEVMDLARFADTVAGEGD